MSTYAFYAVGEHLWDAKNCSLDAKQAIDAHAESIECIDAHPFTAEHVEQVCARCDGEGCKWSKS
jgi:hypothetical protein